MRGRRKGAWGRRTHQRRDVAVPIRPLARVGTGKPIGIVAVKPADAMVMGVPHLPAVDRNLGVGPVCQFLKRRQTVPTTRRSVNKKDKSESSDTKGMHA